MSPALLYARIRQWKVWIVPLAIVVVVAGAAGVTAFVNRLVDVSAQPTVLTLGPFAAGGFVTSTTTMFPQQFVLDQIPLSLSDSFLAQEVQSVVTAEVLVHCKPLAFLGGWMGDVAYMAREDPLGAKPGDGGIPPTTDVTAVSSPWVHVGGDPSACPGDPDPGNLLPIFTTSTASAIVLNRLAGPTSTIIFLGLDVPTCDFNYNPETGVTPTEAGWSKPTLVLVSGDPRYEDSSVDPGCKNNLGMDIVIQVVDIY